MNKIDPSIPFPQDFDWNEAYSGETSDYVEPDAEVVQVVDALPPGRALDVGCGSGGLLGHLGARGWHLTGVDIAEKAVEASRRILQERGLEADLYVADASQWSPPGKYDLITSSFSLPVRRSERAHVFSRMREALAPGGTIVIKEYDASMQRHTIFLQMDLPTRDELRGAFAGLEVEHAKLVDVSTDQHPTGGDIWTAAFFVGHLP